MDKETYSQRELKEIREEARSFKRRNFFRLPCIVVGNKVASRNPDSKIRNYSTITECFSLSTGKWIYLIYAYPFSIVHRLLDGLAKWATRKYCIKIVSPKKWKKAFVKDSFIPVIPIEVSNVVAMPYIENENLFDILAGRIGDYCFLDKEAMIMQAVEIINKMHTEDIVWGELVTQNMIRSEDGKIIICDTETVYYRGSLVEQKASDWFDFICSACGSMANLHPEKVDYLILMILNQIQDVSVKYSLRQKCEEKKTWLHRLFFLHTQVRLTCSSKLYGWIKEKIHSNL